MSDANSNHVSIEFKQVTHQGANTVQGNKDQLIKPNHPCFATTEEFANIVTEVRLAIQDGVNPIRIQQGSSGSYFVRNRNGEIVGVFKPKNEEPYGKFNPKWTKWLHKTCLPCCFGRSCLIPNQGYLSESAASIVDRRLNLNVCPRTEIVELSSQSFYYGPLDRRQAKKAQGVYPAKIGSFQLFLKGYKDSSIQLQKLHQSVPSPKVMESFQEQFERLVILDFLIRNTDRGMDNWMMHYDPEQVEIFISAIDNGLAFPFKHPDNWRSYPFGWLWLTEAKQPFSVKTIESYLPILKDRATVDIMISELEECFQRDKDYDSRLFSHQVSLLRGQIHNIIHALENKLSPLEMVRLPRKLVINDILVDVGQKEPCFSNW